MAEPVGQCTRCSVQMTHGPHKKTKEKASDHVLCVHLDHFIDLEVGQKKCQIFLIPLNAARKLIWTLQ